MLATRFIAIAAIFLTVPAHQDTTPGAIPRAAGLGEATMSISKDGIWTLSQPMGEGVTLQCVVSGTAEKTPTGDTWTIDPRALQRCAAALKLEPYYLGTPGMAVGNPNEGGDSARRSPRGPDWGTPGVLQDACAKRIRQLEEILALQRLRIAKLEAELALCKQGTSEPNK